MSRNYTAIIDNQADNTLYSALVMITQEGRELWIATAFFSLDALNLIGEHLTKAEKIKLIFGDDASAKHRNELIKAMKQPFEKTLLLNPIGLVQMQAVKLDGKTLVRIQVKSDPTERYRFKDQIYVRRNTKSKRALTADEAAVWWPKRQRGGV